MIGMEREDLAESAVASGAVAESPQAQLMMRGLEPEDIGHGANH